MNIDIRLSVGFWQHPKTKKTAKRLGLEGVRSLQVLWLWAAVNRPDGVLSGMDWEDIEMAADWQGDERAFFDCCLGIWIDETDDGFSLHDWAEHNSWAADAEDRSDKARFSRLATVNRQAFDKLKATGVNAISKEEYDRLTSVRRSPDDRQANAGDSLAPAPAPAPAPKALREDPSLRSGSLSPDAEAPADQSPTIGDDEQAKEEAPPCPHQRIIATYHEVLPELAKVKTWDEFREGLLRARWRETWARLREKGEKHDLNALLDWWRQYFATVRMCPWLMGREQGRDGRPFYATLEWLVRPRNYAKVLEGFYRERRRAS